MSGEGMSEIKVGTVTIILPNNMVLDSRAGKLSSAEIKTLPRARNGVGLACKQTAAAMEKSKEAFFVPGVDAAGLRAAGDLAENIDQVIEDMTVALKTLKQGNMLADAEAFTMLRKVNMQVKAQSQFAPYLLERFQAVRQYFALKRKPATPPETPSESK
jgi:hypothetical protein